jgi:hypothetical protein
MKKINIEIPIIISTVKDHFLIKPKLLRYIDELPNNSMVPGEKNSDIISKTDWNLPDTVERKYLDFIKPIVVDTLTESFRPFKINGLSFSNFWFQQYYQSDFHGWHTHIACHWSNVYFVELPDKNIRTEIQNIGNETLIDYEVSEGDIISFPAMLYHRSPINVSNDRKTVIAFNTNFISHFEDAYD